MIGAEAGGGNGVSEFRSAASGSFPAILRVESDMDGQDVQDRTFPSLHPVYPVHPCSISRFFNSEREQRIPTRNSSRNDPLAARGKSPARCRAADLARDRGGETTSIE